jgi:hypothetical protein
LVLEFYDENMHETTMNNAMYLDYE